MISAERDLTVIYEKTVIAIEIQGLRRIEKDAMIAKLQTKINSKTSAKVIRQDVTNIFKMGFFDDVEVLGEVSDENHCRLTYKVKERPAIAKILFDGNERISTSDLKEVIKVKEWSILDINKVKEDIHLIQRHYEDKGFYLAKVNFSISTTKDDEVELTFKISDYEKIQIKKITFLNNKRFSDEQLKAILQDTREGGNWSFLSGAGNFKETAFKQDMQRLTYWYLDHGYVKFRPENPVVTVSDDKKWLFISIYVEEGDQYKMGDLDFGGDLLFSKDELFGEVILKKGDIFSISKRNADIQKLTEKYQDLGYAFVNVIPNKMNIHEDSRSVDIQYDFEKGNLVHFGEINILGNSKTHDKVIRRELKVHEGELYSGTKLRISKENVERLGYFAPGEVIFNTVTPKGKPDILNLDISIKERSTGTITLGAGYGSGSGFFFTSSISEMNLLGRGQTISFSAQMSAEKDSRRFTLGFTDPYAFDSHWSLGFDVYRDVGSTDRYGYRKLGFDIRAGHPIAEYVYAYITYKNEGFVVPIAFPLPDYLADPDRGVVSSLIWTIIRDKRNNRFETTAGNYQNASLETAILGGKKKFIKLTLNNRFYARLLGDLVFRNNTELGQINGWNHQPPPPSEKFSLGGPNNMKGFFQSRLGPRASVVGENNGLIEVYPTGGSYEAFSLFELEYPLIREAGLKWVFFFDVGNTWENFPIGGSEQFVLRADAGVGLRWFSPIGPLRFEWGFPFSAKPGEDSPVFSFFIGPPF